MDNMLIIGATQIQHDEHILEVLRRLKKEDVTLNSNTCQLSVQEVVSFVQTINVSGISPDQDKIKAIINMPEPTEDNSGTRRFLGMINQFGKFTTTPSGDHKTNAGSSNEEERLDVGTLEAKVFCAAEMKSDVSTGAVSVKCKPRYLSADNWSYGLGAVLLLVHKQPDGEQRPAAYASRAMSGVCSNIPRYAQIKKETLATQWHARNTVP